MTIDINVTVPVVNAGLIYVNGLQLAVASNTTLTMQAGAARDNSNTNDIIVPAAVTIDSAVNGINGLDVGVLAINTWYGVFAAGDSYKYNVGGGVLSLNFDTPNPIKGYDMFELVGFQLTDGSAHFLPGLWVGNANERHWDFDTAISESAGGASATFAAIDVSSSIPVAGMAGYFGLSITPTGAGNGGAIRPTGSSSTNGVQTIAGSVAGVAATFPAVRMITGTKSGSPGVASIDYKVTGAMTILTTGFDVSL